MKNTITLSILFLAIISASAQDITGQWHGVLKEIQLRLVLNISKTDTGYSSTMDSPDQGTKGIPVTTTSFEDSTLQIAVTHLGITFSGELTDNNIKGTFVQNGFRMPLELSREKIEKLAINRPQEPKMPYPYYTEEVTFNNEQANITLAGTLTLPKKEGKNHPVVILITGSGPQDRNEELVGHKPFLVIADHLTKKGIAVLRYDDRGFGQSTGDFETATSADFAFDVESAINYLKTRKEIDSTKIGLIGHSEGGLIAPMVASKSKDVNFIILLAGTGIPGDQLLLLQGGLIEKAMGRSQSEIEKSMAIRKKVIDITVKSDDITTLRNDLNAYLKNESSALIPEGTNAEQFISAQVNFMATPWMVYFLRHDPAKVLEKVTCPILAVNGEKDLQVPPEENLTAIGHALKRGGNSNVTLMEFPSLNHLFQECETGSPSEYGVIEQTFSPMVLTEISSWILKQIE